MKPTPLSQIAEIIGATVHGPSSDSPISQVQTYSRDIRPGELFVGLPGEKFDGGSFAEKALADGAAAVVVAPNWLPENPSHTYLVVPDPVEALQKLARWYRRQFDIPVVAITGSVGKTTITALTYAAFQDIFPSVVKTYKNYNGQLGMPISIFQMEEQTRAAVFEAGISEPGNMDRLGWMLEPTAAVVANAGPCHLETLGSVDNVAHEKLKLLEYLRSGGTAVLNAEDPRLLKAANERSGRVITYGYTAEATIYPTTPIEESEDGIRFRTNVTLGHTVFVPALGRFNALNAMAALGLVMAVGKDPAQAVPALAAFQPEKMRQQRFELGQGVTVLMDAYNASPPSMVEAVRVLAGFGVGRRTVALLGDMFELGAEADAYHEQVAQSVAESGVEAVYFAGARREAFRSGLRGFPGESVTFDTTEDLAAAVGHLIQPGDFVLLKASRGMRFEVVLQALHEAFG